MHTSVMPADKEAIKKNFPHFSSTKYVVGIQKNQPNETILLSTKNFVYTDG